MAKHPPPIQRKRRTREHIIADLSVNFVELQALLCGYSVERPLHDYGIDMVISTYNGEGEVEVGEIRIQLKATDHLKTVQKGRFVSVTIERAHLRSWIMEPMPVILIVYDATNNDSYWLYVQAMFQGLRRFQTSGRSESITLRIPATQRVDAMAMRQFAIFRDVVSAQIQGVVHEQG